MLKTPIPKNARSKRALDNKKSKVIENPKVSLMVKASTCSAITAQALKDLHSLRKPNSVLFTKKNDLHPYDDPRSLEFLSQKNDASLFVVGSHSKKRPNQLLFARLFNHELYDLCEFGLENFVSIEELHAKQCSAGQKPLLLFSGMGFETHPTLQNVKSMLLDFFSGNELVPSVHLGGIEHIIHISIDPNVDIFTTDNPRLLFRCYAVQMTKDKNNKLAKAPRIELIEMGPRMDLVIRRQRWPTNELKRAAHKVPRVIKPTKVKNITKDLVGDTIGRVHVGKQDLSQLQTRKVKALRKDTEPEPVEDDAEGTDYESSMESLDSIPSDIEFSD